MRTTQSHDWMPVYKQCLDSPGEWILAHEYCKKSHTGYAKRRLLETMRVPRNDGSGYSRLFVRLDPARVEEFLSMHTYLLNKIDKSLYVAEVSDLDPEQWKNLYRLGR